MRERGPSRPVSAGGEPLWIYDSSRLQQINAPRRRAWRRLRCQPQMRENALDHRSLFDSRDDLQLAAALFTAFKIKVKNAFEKASPRHTCPRAMRMRALVRMFGCRVRRGNRHYRGAQFAR